MTTKGNIKSLNRLPLIVAALWTLMVIGSLAYHLNNEKQALMELAYAEARTNLNKDLSFRKWGTRHGGVYVPVTPQQAPVPWLFSHFRP